jgi:dynein heavy chain
MRERHWRMLMQTTGKQFVMDERFCLGDLLALELHNYVDACSEIVDRWGATGPLAGRCCC